MVHHRYKIIIGRAELVSFPDHLLDTIPAKTDTGAYRSAVHATDIRVIKKDNKEVLSFSLLKDHPSALYSREVEVNSFKKVTVENSFGEKQERYSIELKLKVGPRVMKTEFTLADRSMKAYPILLGRKATSGRFIVDTSINNIDRKKLAGLKKQFPDESEVRDP